MPQVGIIMLENCSLATAMANSNIAAIANAHRSHTDHEGTSKPSLPDYCAISSGGYHGKGAFGGSPAGIDAGTMGFVTTGDNIMHQIGAAGHSWKAYEEDVSKVGYTTWGTSANNSNKYLSRHCPACIYSSTTAKGTSPGNGRYDFDELAADITAGSLPDFFFITPNSVNDGHDAGIGNAGTWLANGNGGLFPGFTALIGALNADGIIIITTDNVPVVDTTNPITGTGKVLCVVAGPNVTNGNISTYSNHFSLLKGVQSLFGLTDFTVGVDSNYTSASAQDFGVGTSTQPPSFSGVSISGTAQVGQTLTVNYTVSGTPTPTVTRKWVHDGTTTPVLGTGATYSPATADIGLKLDCLLSATNGIAPNASASAGPTAAVTSGGPPANSVTDTFATPSSNSISNADDGHVWQILQGNVSQYNVSGGFLVITAIAGNAPIADIVGYSQSDEEALIRYEFNSLPTGTAGQSIAIALRMTDAANYDRLVITHAISGTHSIRVQKQIANVNTDIVGANITTQAINTKYWLRFRALSDGSYYGKVWQDGTPEPAAWTIQATDPHWATAPGNTSGSVGIRLQCVSGNTNLATFKIDDFSSTVPVIVTGTDTYQYSIDGGAWTQTGASGADLEADLSSLTTGVHYIQVQPINSVTGSGPINTYVWEVNVTTPPGPPVFTSVVDGSGATVSAGGTTQSTQVTVNFTTDVGTTVTSQDNSNTPISVTSPYTLTGLTLGSHVITLVATNAGGATASATFSFTVTSIQHGGPGSGVYSRNITVTGTPGAIVAQTLMFKATDTNAVPLTTQTSIEILVELPSNPGPGVSITDPLDGSTVYSPDGNIAVTVQAVNSNDTIGEVQVTVDGTNYIDCVQQADPSLWVGQISLPLNTQTVITAIATDATDGLTGTDSITVIESTQPPPPPQGQPVPQIRISQAPNIYNVFIVDHNGNDVGVITPQDLKLTQPLNAPDTIEFGINLQDPMANISKLNPDLHDWRFERNGVPLSAGILLGNGVQIDTNSRTMQVSGQSWLGYMSTAFMDYDPTQEQTQYDYAAINVDIFDAARGLVDFIIGGANSIPITYDHAKSGIIITQEWLATDFQDLLTMLTDLGASVQGFDFEVDASCTLHMYSPHKGANSNLYLEQFKNIEDIQYTNPGIKANRVIGVGTGTSNTQEVARSENSTLQITDRLYTEVAQFSNLHTTHKVHNTDTTNQIEQLTASELAVDIVDQLTIVITSRPAPDEDQFALADVGDWIHINFNLEYAQLSDWFRCTQRVLEPDNDGNEIIEYTFTPNTINQGSN